MNLCFEDELSNKSMNFILLSLIVAIVTTNACTPKVLEEKTCAVMGERCKKFSCKGRMIVLDAVMASVERGSCLSVSFASTRCEKHGLCGK